MQLVCSKSLTCSMLNGVRQVKYSPSDTYGLPCDAVRLRQHPSNLSETGGGDP